MGGTSFFDVILCIGGREMKLRNGVALMYEEEKWTIIEKERMSLMWFLCMGGREKRGDSLMWR